MSGWRATFRAVWLANLVTTLGLQSFLPFFPSHLEELGVQGRGLVAAWAGAVYGAAPLSAALMGPVWGSIGDRVGHKSMVLRSLFATAFFVGLMAFARSPLELLLLRLAQGVFSGVIAPSISLVSVGAPRERQGSVAGGLQSALALGAIGGPLFGALVSSLASPRAVFLAVAALAAAGGALVAWVARASEPPPADAARTPTSWLEPFARAKREAEELWRNRRVRAAVALSFWIQFAVSATAPQIELLVRDVWTGAPELRHTITGGLFTAMALASLVATPLWGRWGDEFGHHRALFLAGLLSAAALIGHALAPALALLVLLRIALGASMAGGPPCAFALAAAETEEARRGGGLGIIFSGRSLAIALAALLGGCLSSWLGLRGLFAASGLALLAIAWFERPTRRAKRADPSVGIGA